MVFNRIISCFGGLCLWFGVKDVGSGSGKPGRACWSLTHLEGEGVMIGTWPILDS